MTLNPALTGKFDGLYRVNAIYRGQYYGENQSNSLFRTPGISVDFSLLKDKMNGNALGVGLMVVNDQQSVSGTDQTTGAPTGGKINTTTIGISLGYTLQLDKKKSTQLAIGLQPSYTMKSSNGSYEFPDAFNTSDLSYNTASSANEKVASLKKNYFNFDYGLFFNTKPLDWLTFYIGYSMANVARPQTAVLSSSADGKLPFRHAVHGGFEFEINKRWVIIPGFLYQNEAKANEADAGVTAGYVFINKQTDGKRKKGTFFLGLWNRMGNDVGSAFQYRNITPKIGVEYNNIRVGFAYDITVGNMASDAHDVPNIYRPQAYELAISYIGFGGNPPKENKWLFNPRY
jgi:type IX secretion system PorP/SprF family membrane protein